MKEFNRLNLTPIFIVVTGILAMLIIGSYKEERKALDYRQLQSIECYEDNVKYIDINNNVGCAYLGEDEGSQQPYEGRGF